MIFAATGVFRLRFPRLSSASRICVPKGLSQIPLNILLLSPAAGSESPFWVISGHVQRKTACPISANRWGNRPALLWIAEDFGCCASG